MTRFNVLATNARANTATTMNKEPLTREEAQALLETIPPRKGRKVELQEILPALAVVKKAKKGTASPDIPATNLPALTLNDAKPITSKPGQPEIKVTVLARVSDAPVTLKDVEIDIQKHMETAASSALRIGGLLVLAREFHSNTADFLAWSEAALNIKKAQAYRLIKIHQEFGEDARFTGVAMRVMNMLTGASPEVVKQAAELASAGKLDSKAAEKLTGKVIDISPVKQPENKSAQGLPVAPVIEDAEVLAKELPPWEGEMEFSPVEPQAFDTGATIAPVTASAPEVPSGPDYAIAKQIEELQKALAIANKALEAQAVELSKPIVAPVVTMPMLPQFHGTCLYARLGLSQGASLDSKLIRAAYRALAVIWTADSNAEALNLITEAKDSLLAALK